MPNKKAQAQYEKKLEEELRASDPLQSLYGPFGLNKTNAAMASILRQEYDMPNLRPINQKWWTKLEGNKLTIKIDNLLHTRRTTFDDEYMIAPLKSGIHLIEVRVICEEYGDIKTQIIEMDI